LGTAPRPRSKVEGEFYLRYKTREIIADAVHLIIPYGAFVAIFWFVYLMTKQLAGRTSLAQLVVSIIGELKLPQMTAMPSVPEDWATVSWSADCAARKLKNWPSTAQSSKSCSTSVELQVV
jgi:hypothetical protein